MAVLEALNCDGVGINKLSITNDLIEIYPNPVNNQIQIIIKNLEIAILNIYNVQGKVVYSEEIKNEYTNINVSNFLNGVYLFIIIDKNGNILKTEKVVKN